ncbi:extracellular solute-binding protein [bacterium 1xD42-62]|uniref:Extracellular solute-binding protein n=2 Tax=Parablautia muri TaxID=2320879 RepID=A0A9X5BE07_9FIRM|nr:extracellular solute-binding protein [Parablautia muri]
MQYGMKCFKMEVKMKKGIVLCIAAALAMAFIFAGCGKQKEETPAESKGAGNVDEDGYVYVAQYHPVGEAGGEVGEAVIGSDQKIFWLEYGSTGTKLNSMDMDSQEKIQLPVELGEYQYITSLNADGEGNLLAGVTGYTDESNTKLVEVLIKTLDENGKELASLDVSDTFLQSSDFYISDVYTDGDGNYYVCSGWEIYVLKPDGSVYSQVSPGQYINCFFRMKDGKIGAAYYDDARGFIVNEVVPGESELKPVNSSISFGYGTYQGGTDTDLLYTENGVLLSCNLTDEKPEEILRWTDYDVNSTNLTSVAFLADGRIAALTTDFMSPDGGTELVVLTRKPESEVPEKILLTYGTYYSSFFAERDITAFNRQSEKYRIMIKEYGDASMDYSEKAELFLKDLESGQFPDIIDLTYCPMSLETLISVGAIEDLNPYLDADEVIAREDYVESALKAYERDGKLYAIMPYYGVETLVGKVSEIGDAKTWTVDDVIELMASAENGAKLLPGTDKSGILWAMCTMNQDLFINKETGECTFTGEEFKKILAFANGFANEASDDTTLDDLRSGKTLLNNGYITSVSQYQMYEFMFGGPVNLIGYPTFGESGLTFRSNGTTVAMGSGCENKEGVWEFIRFNVTKERQENVGSPNGGFPILKSALEKEFEKDMEPEYTKDENGNQIETPKSSWASSMGGEEFSVEVYAATKEQVDRVREMIETTQSGAGMDQEVLNIILEEASGYFSGQKTPEDVASVVQNRVQLYLNETR